MLERGWPLPLRTQPKCRPPTGCHPQFTSWDGIAFLFCSLVDGTCHSHKTFGGEFPHFLSTGSGESHEGEVVSHSLSETTSGPHLPVTVAGTKLLAVLESIYNDLQ